MSAVLLHWAKLEVHAIIRFVNARNVMTAHVHCQLVEVYGEVVMSWQSSRMLHSLSGWKGHAGELSECQQTYNSRHCR
jgi:hypothetical protein